MRSRSGRFARNSLRSAFLVSFLLLFGKSEGQNVARQPERAKANQLSGRWIDLNPDTSAALNSVARIEIHSNGESLFVRIWGRCGLLDCDWGEESIPVAEAEDGKFELSWNSTRLLAAESISLGADGLLRVQSHLRWPANSRGAPETYNVWLVKLSDNGIPPAIPKVPSGVQSAAGSVASLVVTDEAGNEIRAGSGFFIQPDLLATNYGILKPSTKLFARVIGRSALQPIQETVHYDEQKGIALVRLDGERGWPLPLSNNLVLSGIDVFLASGSKGAPEISKGSVTALVRPEDREEVEISIPASASDVGGPVLNKRGEVIGLLSYVDDGGKFSRATPASELLSMLSRPQVISESLITRPIMLTPPTPAYTVKARENRVRGGVVLRALVGIDGAVKRVEVVRGLPDGLTEEAVKSLYEARFKAAIRNGRPIESWVTTEVVFDIR